MPMWIYKLIHMKVKGIFRLVVTVNHQVYVVQLKKDYIWLDKIEAPKKSGYSQNWFTLTPKNIQKKHNIANIKRFEKLNKTTQNSNTTSTGNITEM